MASLLLTMGCFHISPLFFIADMAYRNIKLIIWDDSISNAHYFAANCLKIRERIAEILKTQEPNFQHVGKHIPGHRIQV